MTPYETGRISAFLLKYRKVEDRQDKRSGPREERDIAALLREASIDAMRDLEEQMNGHGFELATLTSFDIAGIGAGARVYLLIRKPDASCMLLDTARCAERMEPAAGRTTAAKIWFTQIWLLHLDLLYTQRDRSPAERNLWLDATFTREMLEQAVREHVNDFVRRLNPQDMAQNDVYKVLTAEKGTMIARYVGRFLELMCETGMLEDKGSGVYRQSMLSAVEMKENYGRLLEPFMLDEVGPSMTTETQADDAVQPRLAEIAAALLTRLPEGEELQGDGTNDLNDPGVA
jgi:hypothetical protein